MSTAHRGFPETSWGLVSQFRDEPAGDYRAGLGELCRKYWKPVFHYLRARWARSEEDATDLTQAFFLWLLEGEALKRYAPDRGSFRTFLKVLLWRFVNHHLTAARCIKRGGAASVLALESDDYPLRHLVPDPRGVDPEKALDEEWVGVLVRHAVARTRELFLSQGRDRIFRVFEAYDLRPAGQAITYADLGERLGLRESQVRRYLFVVRQAIRSEIRVELRQLTRDETELEEEWEALFGHGSLG